jgi:HSP20 family molecular chaperone IbpA
MSASLENGILKITVPKEDVQEDAGTKVDIDEK